MELKPRQIEAFDAVFSALERGTDKLLLSIPTGVGKTCIGLHVARKFERACFLVHRTELAQQTAAAASRIDPNWPVGFIAPGQHDPQALTVAMLPTIYRRLNKVDPDSFDAIIIDECHHATSKSWRMVAEHFTGAKLRLGLSATPERSDGSDLSHLFSEIAYSMTIEEAVNENYLVKPVARVCMTSCDLSNVKTVAGDFSEGELATVVDCEERNAFIVEKFLEHAKDRKAIAFTVTVAHAQHLVEAFQAQGIRADWVAGDCTDRAEKLARFSRGETQIMASCQVLAEGYDESSVDCVMLCRPTKSKSLFSQQCGRGLRLHPGKQDCLILDFCDVSGRHRLVSTWRWMGFTRPPKEDEPLEFGGEEKRKPQRMVAAIDVDKSVDLLLPPPEIPPDFHYGQHAWHFEPPTERQLGFLASLGYDVVNCDFSRGQASALIAQQPPSAAQLKLLANLGFDPDQPWTRAQADQVFREQKSRAIDIIGRMRRAGFQVRAAGNLVNVEPFERLTATQRIWIARNRSQLLLALRE